MQYVEKLIVIAFFPLLVCTPIFAQMERNGPRFQGEMEASVDLEYRAYDEVYMFVFPLYWSMGLGYEDERTEALVSVDYTGKLRVGETYVVSKSNSYSVKLGYYVEDWGLAYSFSPISILNRRDSDYPANIFYRRFFLPNPLFSITLGEEYSYDQVLVSNRDENIESIDDTLFGIRKVWTISDIDFGLGAVRKIGFPPTLYFISARREAGGSSAWLELGLEYEKSEKNRWDFVIGGGKQLSFTAVYLEYIIDGGHSFFFLDQKIYTGESGEFEIQTFFHVVDLSFAFHLFFLKELGESLFLEPGVFLFLGERGDYFSNEIDENDNSVYVKFKYAF